MAVRYWLMKSDPDTFGLQHLRRSPKQTTCWDGVRNYQARNLLRDEIRKGDGVLFYHSQVQPPAVVARARVVRAGYPDPTQFDPDSRYFDPKSSKEEPRWILVDVEFVRKLKKPITLAEIKAHPGLDDMILTRRGNRLSIMPVGKEHWDLILSLA